MPAPISPARKALQNRANVFVLVALVADLGGYAISIATHTPLIYRVLAVLALPLWVLGCMAYAESKGHSKWVGLLGVLSCCGLLILVLLPNRWVEPTNYGTDGDYPRPRT